MSEKGHLPALECTTNAPIIPMFAICEAMDRWVPLEEGAVIVIMLASVDAKKVVL